MFVRTEPIETAFVSPEEYERVRKILEDFYRFKVVDVKKFVEQTAASRVYKCALEDARTVVVKNNFWDGRKNRNAVYGLSEILRKKGVALPEIFKTDDGKFEVRDKSAGDQSWAVFAFAPGEHFMSRPEEFESAGRALGIFHRCGLEIDQDLAKMSDATLMPYEESRDYYKSGLREKLLAEHECSVPDVCAAFRSKVELFETTMQFVDSSGLDSPVLTRGFLHNDFHTNNCLFLPDGGFSAFLDIDQAGMGPIIWDIGNTVTSFVSNALGKNPQADIESLVRMFLMAYHRECPLAAAEHELILAAGLRWDLLRILRSLRRHRFESNCPEVLLVKIKNRLLPRIEALPKILVFIKKDWIIDCIESNQ
jgi:Ser/Thr protein kinase RdoA (MazF antagonist)